jgi:molybdate transport system ATP-binding protein
MLIIDVKKRLGDFSLNASFEGASGITALFGPSGSGKTSIIGMVAGLMKPDSGRIAIDGEVLFDSANGIDEPAHKRRVGYVFQDGRLFPHLSVASNLDYGRWMSGAHRDEKQVKQITGLLDIAHLLRRHPGALSGGERQRVALGRALLMKPRLLLLDEPLASLDAARKSEILPYFVRLRDEIKLPMVYVSHDGNEVRALANRIIMIEAGRVAATGNADLI